MTLTATTPMEPVIAAYSHTPSFFSRCLDLGFGIEIEFDAAAGFSARADLLGCALYNAGLTASPLLLGYHAKMTSGARNWRYEEEHTVSGAEVISPRLTSTAETWKSLETVIKLIKRFGGHAISEDSGLHVHVDADPLGDDLAAWHRFLRLVTSYAPELFLVARNPERGRHRGYKHCELAEPLRDDVPDSLFSLLMPFASKSPFINTYYVRPSSGTGHIEFKLWDATLDAAVIQMQIKISVALVHVALTRPDDVAQALLITQENDPGARLPILAQLLFPDDEEDRRALLALGS